MSDEKFMPDANKKRLMRDIARLIKHPLTDNGIYYVHDSDNMLKGYALIFGPSDSIYRYGSYLFVFNYSKDYPYVPPKVTYMTNNGNTRFHPNLYRNGKVCLSLLNTWRGEQWTSCQSVKSILLNLVTLLHNEPLLNEPGVKKSHKDFKTYNKIIQYQNYETAVLGMLTQKFLPSIFVGFFPIIKKKISENKDNILNEIDKLCDNKDIKSTKKYNTSLYSMSNKIDYSDLKNRMTNAFEEYF